VTMQMHLKMWLVLKWRHWNLASYFYIWSHRVKSYFSKCNVMDKLLQLVYMYADLTKVQASAFGGWTTVKDTSSAQPTLSIRIDILLMKQQLVITHTICHTKISNLLHSWVINTPSVRMLCPQRSAGPYIFVRT